MTRYRHHLFAIMLLCLGALSLSNTASAREFRSLVGIASPVNPLPQGAVRPPTIEPVDTKVVEKALYALADAWNGEGLSQLIADDFANASDLMRVLTNDVPTDAKIRILSIQSIQTLDQYVVDVKDGKDRTSIVTVTARTSVEYEDPSSGKRQRLVGLNEFFFRITDQLRQAQ